MSDYPPLKAIHAFEASIRLNSFSLAAEALNVTPGAVGQQVRKLEEWLGVALFHRHVRGIEPTADGLAYAARIQPALLQIQDASDALRRQKTRSVRVVMPPSFAAKWFARHMSRFLIEHPETELHVSSSAEITDFTRDAVDIAIRYFEGRSESLDTALLLRGQAAAYCSPVYREALQLQSPEDLTRATLLNDTLHAWWPEWFEAFSTLPAEAFQHIRKIEIDQTAMAIESAIHGQGVLLAIPMLAAQDVAAGRLVPLFPQAVLPLNMGYYLIYPKQVRLPPQVRLFRDWLKQEAGAMG